MSSTFGGIQQAANSLATASYGLQVVSQNIANANTPGYTRQAAQQAAVDGAAGVPYLYTKPAGPGGVTVTGTARMNDPVLDSRARSEHARGAAADTTASALSNIEQIFPEPSDTGLGEQLNDFWNAWAPVANDPGSAAPRAVLLQKADTVASTLRAMSTSLDNVSQSTANSLQNDLNKASSAAGQLYNVNAQIAIANATGANANSLLDQRDQLLDQLSTLTGAQASLNPNGTANVSVGGQPLVGPSGYAALSADSTHQVRVTAVGNPPPAPSGSDTPVTLSGGSASAEVAAFGTISGYQAQLDAVAAQLISVVNGQQSGGKDLNGNPGAAMFAGTNAHTVTLAFTDPNLVAAAGTSGGALDGSNALATSQLGQSSTAPDALYQKLVGDVAGASSLAQQQQTTQSSVTQSVDALRSSASGVNYDEEVSNMMTYQRAYQASSRVLTTLDSMLDTLINHTGLVGSA
jgi:flagellar hook-associated protein 1 FlgK